MRAMNWTRIAAILGFLAVALGAFGAHALKATLIANQTEAIWETAARYHLIHAVVLLFLGQRGGQALNRAGYCFLAGIVIFSGSLYLLSVTGIKILGAITPLGGLCLLTGWILIFLNTKKV